MSTNTGTQYFREDLTWGIATGGKIRVLENDKVRITLKWCPDKRAYQVIERTEKT